MRANCKIIISKQKIFFKTTSVNGDVRNSFCNNYYEILDSLQPQEIIKNFRYSYACAMTGKITMKVRLFKKNYKKSKLGELKII